MPSILRRLPIVAVMLALAACSTAGGLSPGLSQRMDARGAQLDRAEALGIVNQYRSSTGASVLVDDPTLDATAQALAAQYAKSGTQPKKPDGAIAIRFSAGYYNFAETFSGWRNSPADAAALTTASATRAGIAAVYDPNSGYGVYWVIILGWKEVLDARGLKCPLPVLKMEKRLAQLPAGASLTVLATDPIAKIDIPLFCTQQGHECVTATESGVLRFAITKARG